MCVKPWSQPPGGGNSIQGLGLRREVQTEGRRTQEQGPCHTAAGKETASNSLGLSCRPHYQSPGAPPGGLVERMKKTVPVTGTGRAGALWTPADDSAQLLVLLVAWRQGEANSQLGQCDRGKSGAPEIRRLRVRGKGVLLDLPAPFPMRGGDPGAAPPESHILAWL